MTEWSPTVLDGCPISFIPCRDFFEKFCIAHGWSWVGDRPRSGQGNTLPLVATSRISCDGTWRDFPENFPGFSPDFPRWKRSHSLLADSFLTIQTSLKRQKPLTFRRSLLWILFLENNLKSK
jgi:hypothetical protein